MLNLVVRCITILHSSNGPDKIILTVEGPPLCLPKDPPTFETAVTQGTAETWLDSFFPSWKNVPHEIVSV